MFHYPPNMYGVSVIHNYAHYHDPLAGSTSIWVLYPRRWITKPMLRHVSLDPSGISSKSLAASRPVLALDLEVGRPYDRKKKQKLAASHYSIPTRAASAKGGNSHRWKHVAIENFSHVQPKTAGSLLQPRGRTPKPPFSSCLCRSVGIFPGRDSNHAAGMPRASHVEGSVRPRLARQRRE
jgi:hypothetical protein